MPQGTEGVEATANCRETESQTGSPYSWEGRKGMREKERAEAGNRECEDEKCLQEPFGRPSLGRRKKDMR